MLANSHAKVLKMQKAATMFAPRSSKAQTKAAAALNDLALQHPELAAHRSGRGPAGQMPLRQQSQPSTAIQEQTEQDRPAAGDAACEARRASWDFSRIPALSPGQANRSTRSFLQSPSPETPGTVKAASGNSTVVPADGMAAHAHGAQQYGGVPSIVDDVLRSPGQPLDAKAAASFGRSLCGNFAGVKVHADDRAAAAARAVDARAFAVGNHIVFGTGQYRPGDAAHDSLLAHELTHVRQQHGAPETPDLALQPDDTPGELEAGRVARGVSDGAMPAPSVQPAAYGIHRAPSGSPLPSAIPAGRRAIIQWGDDDATIFNVESLRTGARSGPNAAGSDKVIHVRDLTPESLADVREVVVVIHGETERNPDGSRVIEPGHEPGEGQPRATHGTPGLPNHDAPDASGAPVRARVAGPVEAVTPDGMAGRLIKAGFGKGRWTNYRVRLVMCYAGVGAEESFSAKLSASMASNGVSTEAIGYRGAVIATGTRPVGTIKPLSRAERDKLRAPEPGEPAAANYYPATNVGPAGTRVRRDFTPATKPPVAPEPDSAAPTRNPALLKPNAQATPISAGAAAPLIGSQGQRVFGGAKSRPIDVLTSPRMEKFNAVVMALGMAIEQLNAIGKEMQNTDARTKLLAVRQEIIDKLRNAPGVGAVIELQFLEPEHRFQDIYWHTTDDAAAGRPTVVANAEARQPSSTFLFVEPMRAADHAANAATTVKPPVEVTNVEQFTTMFLQARGQAIAGADTGTLAIEMSDALQRGTSQFGFTDVGVDGTTIRIPDANRPSIEQPVSLVSERSIGRSLAKLKRGIDRQQGRLSEKMKDWFGGAIKLTGHELDPARAHYAAAENYARDKKFGPASSSINAGELQVEEVWAALFEYENGHRPIAPPID